MSPDGAAPSPSLARAFVDGITTFRKVAALLPYLRWLLLMEQLCHLTLLGHPETESRRLRMSPLYRLLGANLC